MAANTCPEERVGQLPKGSLAVIWHVANSSGLSPGSVLCYQEVLYEIWCVLAKVAYGSAAQMAETSSSRRRPD